MRNFCEALPGDRLVHGYDHDLPTVLKKEDGKRTYTIPSSGAKLTYGHAVDVLARYASSLVSCNNDNVVQFKSKECACAAI